MDKIIFPNQMSIYRDWYKSRRSYLKEYKNLCNHYDYKVRVIGGWKFFCFYQDYKTWKNQK